MTQEDRERMAAALQEAEKALQEGEIPVGAALYRGNTLLWADHNRREQAHDPTAHAEMLCMRNGAAAKGDWRLNDCTLYVTLGRCVFGAADPEKGCCGSIYDLPADPALHSTTEWEQDPDTERYAELLSGSFRQKRKTGTERSPE